MWLMRPNYARDSSRKESSNDEGADKGTFLEETMAESNRLWFHNGGFTRGSSAIA